MMELEEPSLKRKFPPEWAELTLEEIDAIQLEREKEIAELQRQIEIKKNENRQNPASGPASEEKPIIGESCGRGPLDLSVPATASLLQYFLLPSRSTGTVFETMLNTSVNDTVEPPESPPPIFTSPESPAAYSQGELSVTPNNFQDYCHEPASPPSTRANITEERESDFERTDAVGQSPNRCSISEDVAGPCRFRTKPTKGTRSQEWDSDAGSFSDKPEEEFTLSILSRDQKNTKPHVLKLMGRSSLEILREYASRTMSATLTITDVKKEILEGGGPSNTWVCTILLNVNRRYVARFPDDIKEKLASFERMESLECYNKDVFIIGKGEGFMANLAAAERALNVFLPFIVFNLMHIATAMRENAREEKMALLFGVNIDDPRVIEMCLEMELQELLPFHQLWLTSMRSLEFKYIPKETFGREKGKVSVTMGPYFQSADQNGDLGKHMAAQGLLMKLHPDVTSYWGILKKYWTVDPDTGKPIPRSPTDVERRSVSSSSNSVRSGWLYPLNLYSYRDA